MTNGIDSTGIINGIITAVGHNAQCFIAKDAASKWSKPGKAIRVAEQAIEAIQQLSMQAQGVQANPFATLVNQAAQAQVPQEPVKPKDDPRLVRLETKVHSMEQGQVQLGKDIRTLLDRVPPA